MIAVTGEIMSTTKALRAYIVQLRNLRGITQEELADAMGMARRSYLAYERGETEDIKSGPLGLAFRKLRAPFSVLRDLSAPMATEETGRRLAEDRVKAEQELEETEALLQTITPEELDALLAERERELEEELTRMRDRRRRSGGR